MSLFPESGRAGRWAIGADGRPGAVGTALDRSAGLEAEAWAPLLVPHAEMEVILVPTQYYGE
jgi:hypothetical protein